MINRGRDIYLQSENVAPDPSNEAGAVTPWQALGHEEVAHARDDGDEHVRVVRGDAGCSSPHSEACSEQVAAGGRREQADSHSMAHGALHANAEASTSNRGAARAAKQGCASNDGGA